MNRTALMLMLLLALVSVRTFGQTSAQRGGDQGMVKADQIKITLTSTRASVVPDSSFAITAVIENTSAHTIFTSGKSFTLTMPPEVDPMPNASPSSEWYAVFPGTRDPNDPNEIVAVQPGFRRLAIFSFPRGSIPGSTRWEQGSFARGVRLVPGDYILHAVCAYWTTSEDARNQKPNYSIQPAEGTFAFVAPQSAILSGSALGGFIAFLLLPTLWLPVGKKFEQHHWLWRIFIVCRGLASSCLLSIIVAILLSRVSESQFLVRVSIQDFWGAVAIGFIVGASGTSVLRRFNLPQAQQQDKVAAAGTTNAAEKESSGPESAPKAEQVKDDTSPTSSARAA